MTKIRLFIGVYVIVARQAKYDLFAYALTMHRFDTQACNCCEVLYD